MINNNFFELACDLLKEDELMLEIDENIDKI